MNDNLLVFCAGFITGSVITGIIITKIKEKLGDNIIERLQECYDILDERNKEPKPEEKQEEVKREMRHFTNIAEQYNSADDKPYVIHPDDYGNEDVGFETDILTLYRDGTLVLNYSGEVIDDIDSYVGEDNLKHMGEYEDDVMYVRNTEFETDYQIDFVDEDYPQSEGVDDS